jgi:hypothetical protein
MLDVASFFRPLVSVPSRPANAVLPGLADLPIRCLPELIPSAWAAQHR